MSLLVMDRFITPFYHQICVFHRTFARGLAFSIGVLQKEAISEQVLVLYKILDESVGIDHVVVNLGLVLADVILVIQKV